MLSTFMCAEPGPEVASLVAVASNIFFVAAAWVAHDKNLPTTSAILAVVGSVSTLFHISYARLWDPAGIACLSWRLFDNLLAHLVVAEIALLLFDARGALHHLLLAIAILAPWGVLINEIVTEGAFSGDATMLMAFLLTVAFIFRLAILNMPLPRWHLLRPKPLIAAGVLGAASVAFFYQDESRATTRDTLFHAAWHALSGIAVTLLVFALPKNWRS